MTWVLIIGGGWLVAATVLALIIARAIRVADVKQKQAAQAETIHDPAAEVVTLAPTDNEAADEPLGPHAAPEPALPTPRPGPPEPDRKRPARQGTRVTVVRDPLQSTDRTPRSHQSGTTLA